MTTSDSSNEPSHSVAPPASDARLAPRRTSDIRHGSALAAGDIGVWRWALDTQRVICDEFTAQLLAIDPDVASTGVTTEMFYEAVVEEDKEAILRGMVEARVSTDLHEVDYRVRHTNGDVLWLRSRGRAGFDQNGQVIRREGVVMDVTAQKRAEDQLRMTTQLLEASQSIAQLGGWELDIGSGQLFWTDETYRIHDTSPEAFNPTMDAGVDYVLPKYRQIISAAFNAALTLGTDFDLELETLTTKGRLINVRTTCVVTMANGRPVKLTGIYQDITERKLAEKTYRDSEDRFRLLVEGTSDVVTIVDAEGRLTYVNDRAVRITGFERIDIIGQRVFDFVHPDDHALALQWFADSLAAGEPQDSFVIRFVHKDGTERHFIWSSTFHFDASGVLTHINSIGHDISQLRKMQEGREELAAIVENSADVIISSELDGKITSWNAGAEKLLGYTAGEILGTSMSRVIPDDKVAQLPEVLVRLGAGHTFKDIETIRRCKDGRLVHVSATVSPIKNADGDVVRIAGIYRDITDRKLSEAAARESQARLELAMQVVEIGPWDWDLVSGHVVFSTEWKAQLGFSADEIGHDINEFESRVHPQDRDRVFRAVSAFRADPALGYDAEYRMRHKDESYRWMHAGAQLILDAEGVPVRMIGAHLDRTDQKNAEKQALQSQRLESLGTLASGVAHDLNNALAPILMSVELLREDYPHETSTLDIVENSALRGASMVRQLLTFPRSASSERVAVDVGRLVVDLQKLMHGTFPKNIDQRVVCEPALPVVLGDATQLHQVLLNLCVNARDAMPGGGALTLSARCQAYQVAPPGTLMPAIAGNYIVVTVSDTGAGIPADTCEQIFDPFFTTKEVHKGTGLGLSTVLGIIKGHAAFIKVESPPDEGATFTVYLPVDEAARITNSVVDEETAARGHGEKILFVDDETAITEVMSAGLARLNYRSLTATDGADGLSQALDVESEIAAVITDLHMPHMDGLTMTRAMLRQRPDMPVLVTSGRMSDREAAEFRALGVTHWLAKPFTEHQLAVALNTLLSTKEP